MFSRRVFELMAAGTPIVSTYAKGIEELFDSDAVWLVNSESEAHEAFKTLMTDDQEWRRRSLLGIREVFAKHTYAHRINEILAITNEVSKVDIDPKVTLLIKDGNENSFEQAYNFLQKQSYKNIYIYIISNSKAVTKKANINYLKKSEIRSFIESDSSSYFGLLNMDNDYGSDYLQDLINATRYQPKAIGWSKSLSEDKFAFNHGYIIDGSIWSKLSFIKIIQNKVSSLNDENIFTIDANELSTEDK
jgi:hypothetical protein